MTGIVGASAFFAVACKSQALGTLKQAELSTPFYLQQLNEASKEIGSEQIPKSTIVALGKVPGSEGDHGQTAKHRQYCVSVARLGSTH